MKKKTYAYIILAIGAAVGIYLGISSDWKILRFFGGLCTGFSTAVIYMGHAGKVRALKSAARIDKMIQDNRSLKNQPDYESDED